MVTMPELDPAAVLATLASDPQLRVFVGEDGVATMPARKPRRRLLLDVIAQAFEPGVHYPEQQVSRFLGVIYPDYAALRRYLVDEQFLSRSAREYWRSGGTVSPSTVSPSTVSPSTVSPSTVSPGTERPTTGLPTADR
jgi:hypothetical protein